MSFLEDIFLQDEANEAQELERVIEGDEYDERPRSAASNSDENSAKEDEAEEDKRRVDPSSVKIKRVVKNPRFILNPARLTGPRGIEIIPEHFKDFKFKGKGHEKEDLDLVLKKLEHWAYRLYPKFGFEDCIKKIETLGKKRPVMVHLQKIRSDQLQSAETVVQRDSSDDEDQAPREEDEFDKLLQQQIEIARATPAPESARKPNATPRHVMSPFTMPKATSSPSISDEQKERMLRNRKLAEERRLARLKQNTSNDKLEGGTVKLNTLHKRLSNEHEYSDSEEERSVNIPVAVEINTISNNGTENTSKEKDKMFDNEFIEQQKDPDDLKIKLTNTKTVDTSELTMHTLNYDDEVTNYENIGIQEDTIEMNSENMNTEQINKNVLENIDNTKHQEIGDIIIDTNIISNPEHNKDMEEHEVSNEETCKSPQMQTKIDTLVEIENGCNETELNNANEYESIESATKDTTKVNILPNELSTKDGENVQHVSLGNTVPDNSEIDKLVEKELMDVDFDDDF